jgi:hypothetical protein
MSSKYALKEWKRVRSTQKPRKIPLSDEAHERINILRSTCGL